MLIDDETEQRIEAVAAALAAGYGLYLIGRDIRLNAARSTSARALSLLDQAYVAGKIAAQIGIDKVRAMSTQQLVDWLGQNDISLNAIDRAMMSRLHRDTERWIKGRSDAWQARIRTALAKGDTSFTAALTLRNVQDAADLNAMRTASLDDLIGMMDGVADNFAVEANRLLQTETSTYFQYGQTANRDRNELVYKVPRPSACKNCIRLHVDSKGNYRRYKLGDVIGNSNIGLPAYAWQFTIGPVHPHCYCVLHYESEESKTQPFSPMGKSATNSCGVPDDPNLIYDDQLALSAPHDHDHAPEELTAIQEALRSAAFKR